MPLTGTGDALGLALKVAVDAVPDKTDRDEVFKAMGNAIVAHLILNGLAAVLVPGALGGGPGLPGNLA
jgi:hypothetical protein